MKTLIFTLIFTLHAYAQRPAPAANELSDRDAAEKLVSVAQDVKNEELLGGITDLDDCKRQFPFKAGTTATPAQIAGLQNCISQKFQGKSAEQIGQISDRLKLETFKLIPSRSVLNITKYLTAKTYKSMTGVNLDDVEQQDKTNYIKSMKFGTKKMLDQQQFFELYKNQMSKNVIYEISRFCFESFRNSSSPTNSTATNFLEHWEDLKDFGTKNPTGITPTDIPTKSFDVAAQTTSPDAETSYPLIVQSIVGTGNGSNFDPDKLSNFFMYCGAQINELCKSYEATCPKATATTGPSTACTATQPGAKACLTKTKILAFRRALAASEESLREFTSNNGNNAILALDRNSVLKRYTGGQAGQGEQTYNQLTNTASIDFFKATESEDNKKAEDCAKNGGNDCDEFSIVDDSVEKIRYNSDLVYAAKRQAEIARIRELKGQSLDEYLEKNYPDIKKRKDDGDLQKSGLTLEDAIAQRWDSQRDAIIAEVQTRIAPRQISEAQAASAPAKEVAAKLNATTALTEKARLSQVIFFNNIISSSLQLQFASGQSAGRNTQAIKNELDSAETEIQNNVFSNLRSKLGTDQASGGSAGGGNTISDIGILYELIGIPKEEKNQNGQRSPGSGK